MLKKILTGWQMSETAFVEQAAHWTKELTRMRSRGPGDAENAMRGLEKQYGIEYWTTWQLRYRIERVKKIGAGAYARIQAAYEAEQRAQLAKLKADIERTEAIAGPGSHAVCAAKALVGEE